MITGVVATTVAFKSRCVLPLPSPAARAACDGGTGADEDDALDCPVDRAGPCCCTVGSVLEPALEADADDDAGGAVAITRTGMFLLPATGGWITADGAAPADGGVGCNGGGPC